MSRLKKSYGSILLLGLFLIPTVYGFVHVLSHHLPGISWQNHSEQHSCAHEQHGHKQELPQTDRKSNNPSYRAFEKECPVVAFKMAQFDSPQLLTANHGIVYTADLVVLFLSETPTSFSGLNYALRAPPSFS